MRRQDDGSVCGARGFGHERRPNPRAATGLHSQALGPAARSWLTGVAGPRSRKRGPCAVLTPPWRAERRPRVSKETCGQATKCRAHWRATPSALLPGKDSPSPCWPGAEEEGRLTRGRSNNTGDNPWLFDIRIEEGTTHPHSPLIPAKAGIQLGGSALGPRFRGDERGREAAGEVTISRPSS